MTWVTFRKRPSPFLPRASSRRCRHPGETIDGCLGLGGCIWTVMKSWAWLASLNAVGIPCLERLLADGRALRLTCSPVLLSLHFCYVQAVIQPRRKAGAFLVTARALFMFPILSSKSMKRWPYGCCKEVVAEYTELFPICCPQIT